ncbi:hypothetical protein ACO2Q8_17235 [Larkinella sp. VNQ87]|uniref:hypothetical protein n=1 Tax=Larkinella sp. VNQ87 TaxID=3400921 RepID=UPI003C087819
MSYLSYPEIGDYKLPGKTVLVISCIDLRLTDNLLHFLHFDNLHNRYDHFALAGTSLCTHAANEHRHLFKPPVLRDYNAFTHWKRSLDEHLAIAINLHDIRDVYIIEHQDCGAYKEFLQAGKFESYDQEFEAHSAFALALSKEIHEQEYTRLKPDGQKETYHLNVHCFFIDLRGNVSLIDSTTTKPKLPESPHM